MNAVTRVLGLTVVALGAGVLALGCPHPESIPLEGMLHETMEPVLPEDPAPVLESAATSLDPSVRARALYWLTRAERPGGAHHALRGLYDPDAWVQAAVVDALVLRVSDPGAESTLLSYVVRSDGLADPYVRGHAATALVRAGLDGDALRRSWHSEHEGWRVAPLALAPALLGDAEALEALADSLRAGELPFEPSFFQDLASSGLESLLPALGAARLEPELEVPYAVARALLGDSQAASDIQRTVTGPDESSALDALDLLVAIDGVNAAALLRSAASSGNPRVQAVARLALLARGDGDIAFLERAAGGEDRMVRALALRCAREIGVQAKDRRTLRRVRDVVARGFMDSDAEVRRSAVRASVDVKVPPDRLKRARVDVYPDVRLEAAGVSYVLGSS